MWTDPNPANARALVQIPISIKTSPSQTLEKHTYNCNIKYTDGNQKLHGNRTDRNDTTAHTHGISRTLSERCTSRCVANTQQKTSIVLSSKHRRHTSTFLANTSTFPRDLVVTLSTIKKFRMRTYMMQFGTKNFLVNTSVKLNMTIFSQCKSLRDSLQDKHTHRDSTRDTIRERNNPYNMA